MKEDWIKIGLKKISENIQYGYTASSSKEDNGVKFLRITDIQNNTVNWENVPSCIIDESKKEKYLLKKGDLLFARTGATVGKSFLINTVIPDSVFASYLIRVRLMNSILNETCLSYFFQSPNYWQQISEEQSGIGQPNVNGTKLGKLSIPLPPLPIQRAIVAKIEELFSSLDSGIADLKIAQKQINVYRQALLKKAFEGLTEQTTLGEIAESTMIGMVRSNTQQNSIQEGVGYVKMNNVDMNGNVCLENLVYVKADEAEIEKYKLAKDDILINTRNSYELVGKSGIIRNNNNISVFNNNLMRIRTKKPFLPLFIAYQLISPFVRKQMEGHKKATTSVCALYQRNILPLKFKVASKDIQTEIVENLELKFSICDKTEENITENLEKAKALGQSILKKAFEGKLLSEEEIEKCKKEVDYEPASVLLDKIKSEKK